MIQQQIANLASDTTLNRFSASQILLFLRSDLVED